MTKVLVVFRLPERAYQRAQRLAGLPLLGFELSVQPGLVSPEQRLQARLLEPQAPCRLEPVWSQERQAPCRLGRQESFLDHRLASFQQVLPESQAPFPVRPVLLGKSVCHLDLSGRSACHQDPTESGHQE